MAYLRSLLGLQFICRKELGHIAWRRASNPHFPFSWMTPKQTQSFSTVTDFRKGRVVPKIAERHMCSTFNAERISETEADETDLNTSQELADDEADPNTSQELVMLFLQKELSDLQWTDVFQRLSREDPQFNEVSCDAMIMRRCLQYSNYALGTSYMNYIKDQGRLPNLATLSLYLRLCSATVSDCGEEKILEVYRHLLSQAKVLDATLSESVILGLCATREWRKALKHLATIKRLCNVGTKIYSAIIAAAFRHGDYDTGWQYLETMCQEEKVPLDQALLEWVEQCRQPNGVKEKQTMMEILLDRFVAHDLFPKVPVIESIAHLLKEDLKWSTLFVKIPKNGICPACNQQLSRFDVSEEEFKELKSEYLTRVLHGSDIFRSSSPQEWDRFQNFLEERGPFSVVVDGLNVSYLAGKRTPNHRLLMLKQAVEKLQNRAGNGRVLVIGRKHMTKWSQYEFKALKRMAEIYTLDNLTKDDGFFIYAALQFGLGTKVVSSDLLRDHLYRLSEGSLKETFRRWQRQHQILAVPSVGGVHLIQPPSFSTAAQRNRTGWHVPYDDGTTRPSYQLPVTWMCTQAKPHQSTDQDITYRRGGIQTTPFSGSANVSTPKHEKVQHSFVKKENWYPKKDFLSKAGKESHKAANYSKIKNTKHIKKIVISDLFRE